jgi:hypothetical protein
MPATEGECEKALGPLNMYNPQQAIRAQAWYISKLHRQNTDGRLWITYAFYNSGPGTMKKEAAKCLSCHGWNYAAMKSACKRKVLTLKSGKKLDLCNVGYDYPVRVYTYGQQYKISSDMRRYW